MADNLSALLFIEDDADIQQIVRLSLEDIGGFDVRISSSCKEALQQLETFDPQLILLDVMMPEMDGIETMRSIRSIPRMADRPFVFITAKVQKSEIDNYLSQGAVGVIAKPFDPLTLADEIHRLWIEYNGQYGSAQRA